jgi:hypothetical protein
MKDRANAESCFPENYDFDKGIGEFSFAPCSAIYRNIIDASMGANKILSASGLKFVAFSGIYDDYKFFNLLHHPTQSALRSQIKTICYLPWSALKASYPDEKKSDLSAYCANGVYFDDLLYGAYHLSDSQLVVMEEIEGKKIDFTLGAMLYSLI